MLGLTRECLGAGEKTPLHPRLLFFDLTHSTNAALPRSPWTIPTTYRGQSCADPANSSAHQFLLFVHILRRTRDGLLPRLLIRTQTCCQPTVTLDFSPAFSRLASFFHFSRTRAAECFGHHYSHPSSCEHIHLISCRVPTSSRLQSSLHGLGRGATLPPASHHTYFSNRKAALNTLSP